MMMKIDQPQYNSRNRNPFSRVVAVYGHKWVLKPRRMVLEGTGSVHYADACEVFAPELSGSRACPSSFQLAGMSQSQDRYTTGYQLALSSARRQLLYFQLFYGMAG